MRCDHEDVEEFDLELDRQREENDRDNVALADRRDELDARISANDSEAVVERLRYDKLIAALQADLPMEPALWRA